MRILATETSCDEAAAVVIETRGVKVKVLSNVISSQVKLHAKYGGIAPNLATRENGISYSKLIAQLKKSNIELDRKIIADIAEHNPEIFKRIASL